MYLYGRSLLNYVLLILNSLFAAVFSALGISAVNPQSLHYSSSECGSQRASEICKWPIDEGVNHPYITEMGENWGHLLQPLDTLVNFTGCLVLYCHRKHQPSLFMGIGKLNSSVLLCLVCTAKGFNSQCKQPWRESWSVSSGGLLPDSQARTAERKYARMVAEDWGGGSLDEGLLPKCGAPSLRPRTPVKKLGIVVQVCTLSPVEARMGGYSGSLVGLLRSSRSEGRQEN